MAEIQTYLYGKKFPNRIFVGGLPVNTKASELAQFFELFGHVTESKIILDDSGISKGYGFVTFEDQAAVKSINSMGIIFFKNKKLNIGPAVKKESPVIQPELVVLPSNPSQMLMQPQGQQTNSFPGMSYYQVPNIGYQQMQSQWPLQPYRDSFQLPNDQVNWFVYPTYSINQSNPYTPLRDYRSNSASSSGSSDDELKVTKRYNKKKDVPPRFLRKSFI